MIDTTLDVWQYLATCQKPLVMYGMGNGADKILCALHEKGLEIADFFASDDFVRGQKFHDKTVLRFDQIKQKYRDFVIVLAFGSSLPSVLDRFATLDEQYDLVAPDVPVSGTTIFDAAFYESHRAQLEQTRQLFSDESSQQIFDNVVLYKRTGRIRYLFAAKSMPEEERELLAPQNIVSYADIGAYRGDTIAAVADIAPNLRYVYAMEPDPRNFQKLRDFCAGYEQISFTLSQAAAWDTETTVEFVAQGNRNAALFTDASSAHFTKYRTSVQAQTLDAMLKGENVDFIKYDVEGSENRALRGSIQAIRRCMPYLKISVYHRSEDLFALPKLVLSIAPSYRLYLRRTLSVPAWDLQLYGVPQEI